MLHRPAVYKELWIAEVVGVRKHLISSSIYKYNTVLALYKCFAVTLILCKRVENTECIRVTVVSGSVENGNIFFYGSEKF